MDTEYKKVMTELAAELEKFSQQMNQKLIGVISDTELSTMNGLMATKDINHALEAMRQNTAAISAQDIQSVSGLLLDMQENFQFHDIVRQTIERLLEAFVKRENIIQKLTRSLHSLEELQTLLVEMKHVNQEYIALDAQHLGSISIQENKPIFEAF